MHKRQNYRWDVQSDGVATRNISPYIRTVRVGAAGGEYRYYNQVWWREQWHDLPEQFRSPGKAIEEGENAEARRKWEMKQLEKWRNP